MSGGGAFEDAVAVSVRHFMQLRKMAQDYTPELLEQILDTVLGQQIGALRPYASVDRDALRAELARRFSVVIEPPKILEGKGEHQVWLPERRADTGTEWPLWNEYRRILLDVRLRPPPVVAELDRTTDDVLGRLEDPIDLDRTWDRRGMVVGQVQSGKTGHYTGLICKALDAGYKVVIVLAGPYNNLRSQVQRRLDEELLQFDTSRPEVPLPTEEGVVLGAPGAGLKIIPLTSQLEDGDFKIQVATHVTVGPGHSPILLVVKKNATVLKTLLRFFATGPGTRHDPSRGRSMISGAPLLVIDDEADYGSINTAEVPRDENGEFIEDYDPTRINQLIRELIRTFRQSAYVGYTATPFANIFIHPDQPHHFYGDDLFPESFIVSLQPPSDYMGPKEVFGIGGGSEPLPLVRYVDDNANFVPDGHRNGFVPSALSASVREALRAFLLTCAVRRVRGQRTVHNSMLIHVTRFVSTQQCVADLVRAELDSLRDRLRFGDGSATPPLREDLRTLWEKDFLPTSEAVGRLGGGEAWIDVDIELLPSVEKTNVRIINGSAGDVLDYKQNEAQGLNVIAIGGDKLSRGLTLEGLSVSYYLRSSRRYLYDTLLQMGRWFGYRSGYKDLCRIYTTDSLAWNYERIAAADQELRDEFNDMADRRETPRSFGLRVRTHPGLLVTSAVKMRNSVTIDISYQGKVSETIVFDPSTESVDWNLRETEAFLRGIQVPARQLAGSVVWSGVPREDVTAFLNRFRTHSEATEADSRILASYINQQVGTESLSSWSVALLVRTVLSNDEMDRGTSIAPEVIVTLGEHEVTATRRSPRRNFPGEKVTIRRLVSPRHEALDITDEEWKQAESNRREKSLPIPDRRTSEVAQFAREARPYNRGLLLIYPLNHRHMESVVRDVAWKGRVQDPGFTLSNPVIGLALSFPGADAIPLRYTVNPVWLAMARGEE
jgi:hypothetical protein